MNAMIEQIKRWWNDLGITKASESDAQVQGAMSLEKRVVEGGIYYIHTINHDSVVNSLTIEFIKAPEEMSSAKRFLTFTNLEDYSEDVDLDSAIEEAEDGVIDSLIGLDEYPEEEKVMYVLKTENREFIFRTKEKPRIVNA